jgi:hypothetical protein
MAKHDPTNNLRLLSATLPHAELLHKQTVLINFLSLFRAIELLIAMSNLVIIKAE